MDLVVWATQLPQVCCVLPTAMIVVLIVVGCAADIVRAILALILWTIAGILLVIAFLIACVYNFCESIVKIVKGVG